METNNSTSGRRDAFAEDFDFALARKEHEAACREVLHIAQLGDGYHILEIPGPDGRAFRAWPGPFETWEAADLFLDSLVANAVEGNPNNACCSSGIFEFFDLAGRFLAFLQRQDGIDDVRRLACSLADQRPWDRVRCQSEETIDDAPF